MLISIFVKEIFISLPLTSFCKELILSKFLLRKKSDALLEALFAATSILFWHVCTGGIRGLYPLLPTFLLAFVTYQCKMMWLHHEVAPQQFKALFSWDYFINGEFKICFYWNTVLLFLCNACTTVAHNFSNKKQSSSI